MHQLMRKFMIAMKGGEHGQMMPSSVMGVPLINGNNLFTGDYEGKADKIGGVAETQDEWEAYWAVLKQDPPGPLPDNARAIFEADRTVEGVAISLEPAKVCQKDGEVMVEWQRINEPRQEKADAHPHYAVLLIPKGELTASFMDTFPIEEAREKRAKLDEAIQGFRTGVQEELSAPPRAMFMKKYKMPDAKAAP